MCRLQLLLLIVSSVLATVYSIDSDDFNTKATLRPDPRVTNNFARRRYQTPRPEIRKDDVGRYFRRRSRTTTVPSIFSMKVENESQHVYPNIGQLEDTNTQRERNQSHIATIEVPLQTSTEKVIPKEKKLRRRITINNRRHRIVKPIAGLNNQMEEHNEETEKITSTTSTTTSTTTTTTTTTPTPTVTEAKVKEQEIKESYATESPVPVSSLTYRVSQSVKPYSQQAQEKTEQIIRTTTTSMPVSISTTVAEMEKSETASTSSHASNLIVRRRRPHFVQRIHLQPIKEIPTGNENADSSTSAPMDVTSTEKEQEKFIITPPPSYVSDLVSIVKKPKPQRRFMHRGSHKFGSQNVKKEQADTIKSTSSIGTDTIANAKKPANSAAVNPPPPVPTLSPWYDGFGK